MSIIKTILALLLFTCAAKLCSAQTAEDSLGKSVSSFIKNTSIGGYGELVYHNDLTLKQATENLTRAVIFIGHRFNNKISFFSELEIEDAKVDPDGGEAAFEQAYLKLNLNKDIYITAGLFLPRIGIINENHLPTNYFGNFRPHVETDIIPSTWRELGVGLYGSVPSWQGFNYSVAVINGLDAENFNAVDGIKDGRFEGRNATARNLAVTAALLYSMNAFRVQVSGYAGGTVGLTPRQADSLRLESGTFGTPLLLGEGDVSYVKNGFSAKALFTIVNISKADEINRAFANNCPETMIGWYAEAGYNILQLIKKETKRNLSVFARYESVQVNYKMPDNGIKNDANNRQYVTAGISYFPLKGVVIKADYQLISTGIPNPALIVNPNPVAAPYFTNQNTFNLGIGYSF